MAKGRSSSGLTARTQPAGEVASAATATTRRANEPGADPSGSLRPGRWPAPDLVAPLGRGPGRRSRRRDIPLTSPTTTIDSPGWVGTHATAATRRAALTAFKARSWNCSGGSETRRRRISRDGQEPVAPLDPRRRGGRGRGAGETPRRGARRPPSWPQAFSARSGQGGPQAGPGAEDGDVGEAGDGPAAKPIRATRVVPAGAGQGQAEPGRARPRDRAARSPPGRARAGPRPAPRSGSSRRRGRPRGPPPSRTRQVSVGRVEQADRGRELAGQAAGHRLVAVLARGGRIRPATRLRPGTWSTLLLPDIGVPISVELAPARPGPWILAAARSRLPSGSSLVTRIPAGQVADPGPRCRIGSSCGMVSGVGWVGPRASPNPRFKASQPEEPMDLARARAGWTAAVR